MDSGRGKLKEVSGQPFLFLQHLDFHIIYSVTVTNVILLVVLWLILINYLANSVSVNVVVMF